MERFVSADERDFVDIGTLAFFVNKKRFQHLKKKNKTLKRLKQVVYCKGYKQQLCKKDLPIDFAGAKKRTCRRNYHQKKIEVF